MMTFFDALPTDLLANSPSAIAAIVMAWLFLKRDAVRDARDIEKDKARAADRREYLRSMEVIAADVAASNERVEVAMSKLLEAKTVEAAALSRLADRIDSRMCPAIRQSQETEP